MISVDPNDQTLIKKKFITKREVKDKNGKTIRFEITEEPNDINFLIQEAILMFYFADSDYIVKLRGIHLKGQTITTERWSYSLRKADDRFEWTPEQKMNIYRDVLIGMSHMQSRGVIHADIKYSNILFDHKTGKVCLCDLGLSGIIKYAKVHATCLEYSPSPETKSSKGTRVIGHDMFSLCVAMCQLFCGLKVKRDEQLSPQELRKFINSSKLKNEKIKKSLLMMVPDDISNAASANKVLKYVFGITAELPVPKPVTRPNLRVNSDDVNFIMRTILTLAEQYKIMRHKRCFNALISYLNNPANNPIKPEHYDVYIAASLLIYSSLFSIPHPRLTISRALDLTVSGYTMNEFETVITKMMTDKEFVDFTMYPYNTH